MKFIITEFTFRKQNVAPLVGAWIEISKERRVSFDSIVAPLVGAWIEMFKPVTIDEIMFSRSSCRSVD